MRNHPSAPIAPRQGPAALDAETVRLVVAFMRSSAMLCGETAQAMLLERAAS